VSGLRGRDPPHSPKILAICCTQMRDVSGMFVRAGAFCG
jgi:hypothetical protein